MPAAELKGFRTLTEQINDIGDPAPTNDIDPEGFEDIFERRNITDDDVSDEDAEEDAGREHYEAVGKSKLRKTDMPELGRQYKGAKVGRDMINEEEVESDLAEDEDMEDDDDDEGSEGGDSVHSAEESDGDDSQGSQPSSATEDEDQDMLNSRRAPASKPAPIADRAELRAMMVAEQKAVASTISQAAREDAEKGAAVKTQRQTHGSLLRTRIQLQKAVIEANSIPYKLESSADRDDANDAIQAAEQAALNLLNNIAALQSSLKSMNSSKSATPSSKRSFTVAFDTPSSAILEEITKTMASARPSQRATLDKWAQKTHVASLASARSSKLGNSTDQQQSLSSVLDGQLTGSSLERHILKTQVPRSCAPLHAGAGIKEDAEIYDDADWYAVLLQELIDTKAGLEAGAIDVPGISAAGSGLDAARLRRENRMHRRGVDVKASKGRKMRFTVHEKLQNFVAPRDVSSWNESKKNEFFAGLLGRRVQGGLREDVGSEDGDVDEEMEGLKLFQG